MNVISVMLKHIITKDMNMHGVAYCTAHNYRFLPLVDWLKSRFKIRLYPDVAHCILEQGDVYFFKYGCAVFWNTPENVAVELLDAIALFEATPLQKRTIETFDYDIGSTTLVSSDELILADETDSLMQLTFSYGFAQSAKLSLFEDRIEQAIEGSFPITEQLANKGAVSLSKREIGRRIGALFVERSSINLESNFLDVPDFFWDNTEYEPYYKQISKELDIKTRTQSLNRKLEMIHELFQILGDAINATHSTKMELIIIILISVEVVLGLLHFIK